VPRSGVVDEHAAPLLLQPLRRRSPGCSASPGATRARRSRGVLSSPAPRVYPGRWIAVGPARLSRRGSAAQAAPTPSAIWWATRIASTNPLARLRRIEVEQDEVGTGARLVHAPTRRLSCSSSQPSRRPPRARSRARSHDRDSPSLWPGPELLPRRSPTPAWPFGACPWSNVWLGGRQRMSVC